MSKRLTILHFTRDFFYQALLLTGITEALGYMVVSWDKITKQSTNIVF